MYGWTEIDLAVYRSISYSSTFDWKSSRWYAVKTKNKSIWTVTMRQDDEILEIKRFSFLVKQPHHHHIVLLVRISLTFAIHPNHPSLPAGFPNYILCSYRPVGDKFLLVGQHLYVCVKGSVREHHLWVRPYFSSSVPHVLLD